MKLVVCGEGMGVLGSGYMKGRQEQKEPWMVGPLRKAGLLHLLEPETLVDKAATQELTTAIGGLVRSGVFDGLEKDGTVFHELSYYRLVGLGDPAWDVTIVSEVQKS